MAGLSKQNQEGTGRVKGTSITMDIVIAAFDRGVTPEDMCRKYSTLRLADVYAVISYYLQNQSEVREYLALRAKEAEEDGSARAVGGPRQAQRIAGRRAGLRKRDMPVKRERIDPRHDHREISDR